MLCLLSPKLKPGHLISSKANYWTIYNGFFFFFFLPFVIYFFIFNLPDFQAIHQDKALRDLVSFYILQTPSQE